MPKLFMRAIFMITAFPLAGCVHHTFAPGPGMSAFDFEPDAARCRLAARGATSGFAVEAAGSPRFVAAYTAGALIGSAIGAAVQQNRDFNDCMQARGWRVADGRPPVPEAGLAVPLPPVTSSQSQPIAIQATATANAAPTTTRRPLLIRASALTPAIAQSASYGRSQGVAVQEVLSGGAGASAGLRPGDIIVTFNGALMTDVTDLQHEVETVAPGHVITALVWRDRSARPIDVHF
jgi:S1-C subfamily serine protease